MESNVDSLKFKIKKNFEYVFCLTDNKKQTR